VKALKLIDAGKQAVSAAEARLKILATIIPPGDPARQDVKDATSDAGDARSGDGIVAMFAREANRETGDAEQHAREVALEELYRAMTDKRDGIDALTRAIASAGSG